MQLFTKKRVLVAGALPVAGAATFAYAKRGHEAKTPPLKYRASVVDTGSITHTGLSGTQGVGLVAGGRLAT
jgi:hypothetical protein